MSCLSLTRHTTPSEQFLNIMINKTYHTFRTVPKYNDKQDIPHHHNSLSLYYGTVLKVWYVLFFIIFRNCSEGVVCLVYHYIKELFWSCGMSCFSLYLGTVLKAPSEQFLNIMINKTYPTFRTVPKYNDKQDIPHLQNSS
jgi:hypothetical protein